MEWLGSCLKEQDHGVSCIHGEMDFNERKIIMQDFVNGQTRLLITTDLLARGIDIQQVSTVINFDIPKCVHTYLHRIGRSGRWGRSGVGISFITRRDFKKVKEIEAHYSTSLQELPSSFVQT